MQVAVAATCGTYSRPFGRCWNLVTYHSSSCMGKFIIYQFELHHHISILATTQCDINTKFGVSWLKSE